MGNEYNEKTELLTPTTISSIDIDYKRRQSQLQRGFSCVLSEKSQRNNLVHK